MQDEARTLTIKEVDITRPLDQFIAAEMGALKSTAPAEHMIRNSWSKARDLLVVVADELDQLLGDEEILNAMGIDRHQRLVDLLGRVRRA